MEATNRYEHRQVGVLMLAVLGGVALLVVISLFLTPTPNLIGVSVLGVLLICLLLFWSLKTEMTDSELKVSFGPGWIRRSFSLSDIVSARAVRNRWYYGWGIRLVPGGWMFNVSGLDAVEIELVSGKKFRIGTDEPAALLAAIDAGRKRG